MKLCLLFSLNVFLVVVNHVGSVNKKMQQKSFNEIFGEKWEEKEKLEEKREIISKYYKIKEKIKQKGRKYSAKEWPKINSKIAKKLGTNRTKIYRWIKELGLYKQIHKSYNLKTNEEKIEIVQKFIEMINEFKQKRKYSPKEWDQNYDEIGKKIGVSYRTIENWKRKFGIFCKRKTEKEKMETMKIYWKIKKENPKMSDFQIAKRLKINKNSISRWKKQFGEEMFQRNGEEQ